MSQFLKIRMSLSAPLRLVGGACAEWCKSRLHWPIKITVTSSFWAQLQRLRSLFVMLTAVHCGYTHHTAVYLFINTKVMRSRICVFSFPRFPLLETRFACVVRNRESGGTFIIMTSLFSRLYPNFMTTKMKEKNENTDTFIINAGPVCTVTVCFANN